MERLKRRRNTYSDLANKITTRKRITRRESDDDNIRVRASAFKIALSCFAAILLFLVIGMLYLSFLDESTSKFQALYFCIITFTTIGYGDFHPEKRVTKLFMSFYVFFGLMVLTSALKGLYNVWVKERKTKEIKNIIEQIDHEEEDEELSDLSGLSTKSKGQMSSSNSREIAVNLVMPRLNFSRLVESVLIERLSIPEYAVPIVKELLLAIGLILAALGVGVLWFVVVVREFDGVDALYLCAMTISTVGYGDVVPKSFQSRMFVMFYAICGTVVTARAMGYFNNAIDKYHDAFRKDIIVNKELKIDDILDMDANGDNIISKEEYLLYKLFQMRLIEPAVVARLERQFNKIDKEGNGTLTFKNVKYLQNALCMKQVRATEVRSSATYVATKGVLCEETPSASKSADSCDPSSRMRAQSRIHPVAVGVVGTIYEGVDRAVQGVHLQADDRSGENECKV